MAIRVPPAAVASISPVMLLPFLRLIIEVDLNVRFLALILPPFIFMITEPIFISCAVKDLVKLIVRPFAPSIFIVP